MPTASSMTSRMLFAVLVTTSLFSTSLAAQGVDLDAGSTVGDIGEAYSGEGDIGICSCVYGPPVGDIEVSCTCEEVKPDPPVGGGGGGGMGMGTVGPDNLVQGLYIQTQDMNAELGDILQSLERKVKKKKRDKLSSP